MAPLCHGKRVGGYGVKRSGTEPPGNLLPIRRHKINFHQLPELMEARE